MELYVFVSDDPLSIRLNSAVLDTDPTSMRFRSGSDLREWSMTIGAILARIRRACGQCRPLLGLHRERCVHAWELERSARLQIQINNDRIVIRVSDSQLASPTRRRRLTRGQVERTRDGRSVAIHRVDDAISERRSIIHRASYAEAIEIFDIACAVDRAYCFRE